MVARDNISGMGRFAATTDADRAAGSDAVDLIRLGRLVWSELPLLAVVNLLAALAGAVVAMLALTAAPLAPFVAALLLGPLWLGATASCDRLLAGEAQGIRDLARHLRRHARTGVGLALVPATVAAVLLGSLAILSAREGQRWLLVPIAIDAAVLVVLAFGCFAVFPLAVATPLRGQERWFAAIALAGRNLTASLGIAALAILLVLSAQRISPFLALTMIGPLCLLTTATGRAAIRGATR